MVLSYPEYLVSIDKYLRNFTTIGEFAAYAYKTT